MVSNATIVAARNILAAAPNSAGVNILVVPDPVALGGNPAVTVKSPLHVNHYRAACGSPESLKHVDPELRPRWAGLVDGIELDTILVQDGVMADDFNAVLRDAIIWHELGHVLLDPTETGRVYLHELNQILAAHGAAPTQAIVAGRRPHYNEVPMTDPNRIKLAGLLLPTWNVLI